MEALEQSVASLGLDVPIPGLNASEAVANPLNFYRAYLARVLTEIADCDLDSASKAIQWPNNIDNGDLAVILPKLRPRAKAQEVAFELIDKVPYSRGLRTTRPFG
jgi:arginyl-tRNA synthetase